MNDMINAGQMMDQFVGDDAPSLDGWLTSLGLVDQRLSLPEAASRLGGVGGKLLRVYPRSKVPHPGWQNPDASVTPAELQPDENAGLHLGYSKVMSLDIDDLQLALPYLAERGIDLAALLRDHPCVVRGRGLRLWYSVAGLEEIFKRTRRISDPQTRRAVFELRCGGSQDLIPGSVHPDGPVYAWYAPENQQGPFALPLVPSPLISLYLSMAVEQPLPRISSLPSPHTPLRKSPDAQPFLVQSSFGLSVPSHSPELNPEEVQKMVCTSLGKRYDAFKPYGSKSAWVDDPKLRKLHASVIDTYCREVSPAELLPRLGYTRRGDRWLSPNSTTGQAGVVLLRSKDGRLRAYSHHADDHGAEDSFGLLCRMYNSFYHAMREASQHVGVVLPDHPDHENWLVRRREEEARRVQAAEQNWRAGGPALLARVREVLLACMPYNTASGILGLLARIVDLAGSQLRVWGKRIVLDLTCGKVAMAELFSCDHRNLLVRLQVLSDLGILTFAPLSAERPRYGHGIFLPDSPDDIVLTPPDGPIRPMTRGRQRYLMLREQGRLPSQKGLWKKMKEKKEKKMKEEAAYQSDDLQTQEPEKQTQVADLTPHVAKQNKEQEKDCRATLDDVTAGGAGIDRVTGGLLQRNPWLRDLMNAVSLHDKGELAAEELSSHLTEMRLWGAARVRRGLQRVWAATFDYLRFCHPREAASLFPAVPCDGDEVTPVAQRPLEAQQLQARMKRILERLSCLDAGESPWEVARLVRT